MRSWDDEGCGGEDCNCHQALMAMHRVTSGSVVMNHCGDMCKNVCRESSTDDAV